MPLCPEVGLPLSWIASSGYTALGPDYSLHTYPCGRSAVVYTTNAIEVPQPLSLRKVIPQN